MKYEILEMIIDKAVSTLSQHGSLNIKKNKPRILLLFLEANRPYWNQEMHLEFSSLTKPYRELLALNPVSASPLL